MISVIIPMFNSEKTIIGCVESVLKQTRMDLIDEIIIIDDGSTDRSASFVEKKYGDDSRIRLIQKENGGVSSARNAGIKASKSEWIALLDSDDIWLPKKIEKQWEMIKQYKKIRFIGCNRNQENVHWGRRIDDNLYVLDLKHILIKNWPHTSTALIKCDVFRKVGLFNESMRYGEDGDMWNRIVRNYPLFYIPISYEIAGGNKAQFGESGLSANLKGMYDGNIRNIKALRKHGDISAAFYVILRIYNDIKYIRRIILTRLIIKG